MHKTMSGYNSVELSQIAFENEADILSSVRCGCYYSCRIFDAKLIGEDDWCDDANARNALCPLCGIDAVLPDSRVDLSMELLRWMHREWF